MLDSELETPCKAYIWLRASHGQLGFLDKQEPEEFPEDAAKNEAGRRALDRRSLLKLAS